MSEDKHNKTPLEKLATGFRVTCAGFGEPVHLKLFDKHKNLVADFPIDDREFVAMVLAHMEAGLEVHCGRIPNCTVH